MVSPNAESENTFCTPALLGSTMCSKIVTTVTNAALSATTITQTPTLTSCNDLNHSNEMAQKSTTAVSHSTVVTTMTKDKDNNNSSQLRTTPAAAAIVTAAPSMAPTHSLLSNMNVREGGVCAGAGVRTRMNPSTSSNPLSSGISTTVIISS